MHRVSASRLLLLLLLVSANGANAMSVCTNKEAPQMITKLIYQEFGDQFNASPSPAGPQRQAIMSELAKKYCYAVSQYPPADSSSPVPGLEQACTLHSGTKEATRVYWVTCLEEPHE